MALNQGAVLESRYRIVTILGQGGFGAVYRAWDLNLQKPCAVKENFSSASDAQAQFLLEAKLLANLHHPNLPRVIDYFVTPQGQYLVMDFVDGQDLDEITSSGPVPPDKAANWISQIAGVLIYLHSQVPPIIHRDIKPANIRVTSQGQAMLVDFGIAKEYDPVSKTTGAARAITAGYSPPEQYGYGNTDARSDVYALSATLYTLLTGQTPPESVQRLSTDRMPLARSVNASVPEHISIVVQRGMALDITQRYQTAQEFKSRLTGIGSVDPGPPRSPVIIAAAVVVGCLVLAMITGGFALASLLNTPISTHRVAVITEVNTPVPDELPTHTNAPTRTKTPTRTPSPEPTVASPSPTVVSVQYRCPLASTGQIVYSSARDFPNSKGENFELYVLGLTGAGPQRLTYNSVYDGSPNVAPDGRRIAFESYLSTNADIYVIDSSGSGLTQLTFSNADDFVPVWSPDGSKIAFYTQRDGNYEIYVMNADGSSQVNLTNNSSDDRLPTWSPDGQNIAFTSNRNGSYDIFVMTADGRNQTQLTNSPANDRDPAWSPGGDQIAFETDRDGNVEIYAMNSDGSGLINISQNPADDSTAAWSFDGTRLSFESTREGNTEIYAMNGDGTCQTRLTSSPRTDNYAAWSP